MRAYTNGGTEIHDEHAYQSAVTRKIRNNANKTFLKTYPRAEEVDAYLTDVYNNETRNEFMINLAKGYVEKYGKLSEKQYELICKKIDERAERIAKYIKAQEEQKALSRFLGVANEKITARVTLDKVIEIAKQKFGYYDQDFALIYLLRDEAGNRLTWKTTTCLDIAEGSVFDIKATVKAHTEYKGEKQTVLQRVKVI